MITLAQSYRRRLEARAGLFVALLVVACAWPATTANKGIPSAGAQGVGQARVFYVSLSGRDRNRGMDPRYPWRTVGRVNRANLLPGDRVLFRGGETFTDNTLMPGEGAMVSGVTGSPITFASYGRGRASLTRGIWLGTNSSHPNGPSHLTFKNLALGPRDGFQGTGSYIAVLGLKISNIVHPYSEGEVGLETEGSHWLIVGNRIDVTGDSGMLLGFGASQAGEPAGGHDYVVARNVITRTGLDPSLTFGTHGIYLKVIDARISNNSITDFRDNGISVRYRDATLLDNYIARGSIGIAWFQYDRKAATTSFIHNTIVDTQGAGIFICGVAESCQRPLEHFVIHANRVVDAHGAFMNLDPGAASYSVQANVASLRGR